jgi:hypothetical protein
MKLLVWHVGLNIKLAGPYVISSRLAVWSVGPIRQVGGPSSRWVQFVMLVNMSYLMNGSHLLVWVY